MGIIIAERTQKDGKNFSGFKLLERSQKANNVFRVTNVKSRDSLLSA